MALAAIGAAGPDLPAGEAVLVLVLLGALLHVHLDVFLGFLPTVFLFLPLGHLRLKDEGQGLSFSLSEGLSILRACLPLGIRVLGAGYAG